MTSGFKKTNVFDHSTAGWTLRGKHAVNACTDCHSWEKWRPPTNDCRGCHVDVHKGQFGRQRCDSCHKQTGFTGRHLKFNHNTMSRFPLKGRHTRVDCVSCHPGGTYKPLPMECADCHQDDNPHGDTFGETPCSNCHSPVDWMKTRFDHSVTGFALEERHAEQPCYRCHPNGTEIEDDTERRCSFCHTDVHQGQFEAPLDQLNRSLASQSQQASDGCEKCHSGFRSWKIPFFDHNISQFALTGQHQTVPCSGCHTEGHFKPIDTACANCHYNFHEGQFSQPCDQCHTTKAWAPLEGFDHNTRTDYRLDGRHEEVDCGKCHIDNIYTDTPQACGDCHVDVHKGKLGPGCDRCHGVEDWSINTMQDHDFGAFRLGGVHDLLPCEECHGPDRKETQAGRGPECVNCHRDPHFGSFGPQCFECHNQQAFLPSTFLHAETGFRLSGAHRFVECRDCHPGRVFGGLPNDCFFCHTQDFNATAGSKLCDHTACIPGGLDTCHNCHRSTSFIPARPGSGCGVCEVNGR
ncbi:MAG: hypothetical protein VYA30_13010 [Myxococcota bacterium]|nr:hypothetical protein [Myxococcota bacterium]